MNEDELLKAARKIVGDFAAKTEALRREYETEIKNILKEIEERKVKELRESLKKLP